MRQLFIYPLLFLFCSTTSYGQQKQEFGQLRIDFNLDSDMECVSLLLYLHDTVAYIPNIPETTIYSDSLVIDSLTPDDRYRVILYDCNHPDIPIFSSYTTIENEEETYFRINNYRLEYSYPLDEINHEANIKHWTEMQFEGSVMNPRWVAAYNGLTNIVFAGYSMGTTTVLTKHLSFPAQFGGRLTQCSISKDTSFMQKIEARKIYEYYTYLDIFASAALRFSSHNQFLKSSRNKNMLFDIGAAYHLPLTFRHVAWYETQKKLINRSLHQFTDLRLFACFGYGFIDVFAEYRPFDFLIGPYPELPQWQFGLKIKLIMAE